MSDPGAMEFSPFAKLIVCLYSGHASLAALGHLCGRSILSA